MDEGQRRFSARLKQLDQKHHLLSGGYSLRMQSDGLLVASPHHQSVVGRIIQPRVLVYVIGFLWVFKGLMIATLGSGEYQHSVARLANGTVVEQAGAAVMQADPVAQWIAAQISLAVERYT